MKYAFVSLILSLAALGADSMGSFRACVMNKIKLTYGPCGTGKTPRCAPECASALGEVVPKMVSCCLEAPPDTHSACEAAMKRSAEQVMPRYNKLCHYVIDDFTAAMSEILPFDFHSDDEHAVAVVKAEPATIGTVAVGAAAAGAVGASVALAVASLSARKRDALLAN
eukprot:TRINITY_DN1571_c0_g1_i3.p1 TRINITY_DN1571_c0_g1~~TRINITY_DN1571_c0_g1_i3.p1  ORF type:complete len:194 (-),score=28.61 TRINITY_DN1571_c0_g1_i3:71-574(-)